MFEIVPFNSIFQKPAQLWIFGKKSPLYLKMDYLMGFPFANFQKEKDLKTPILISSSYLSNKFLTLYIPFQDSQTWLELVQNYWKGFQKSSLKLFLPKEVSLKDLENFWKESSPIFKIQCIKEN